ncbi:MAG: hypothetical protein MN733_13865 [Nitrososphaera sp.]|nr:hypothetical protein [Nitrososphaera sp.]
MVVKGAPRFLIIVRSGVLWATGLRYAFTLVRLGAANATVIRDYQRRRMTRNRGPILQNFWLTANRYARLFQAFPALETKRDANQQERLLKILQETKEICSRYKLEVHPLTAPSAIQLQAGIMTHTFLWLFGLKLMATESETLGKYGSVNLAIRDFLKYCDIRSDTRLPLSFQLPLFVAWAERHNSKLSSRRSLLLILARMASLEKQSGWMGRITSLCFWAEQFVYRMHWGLDDARERIKRFAWRSQAHEMACRKAVEGWGIHATGSQKHVLIVLANEMLLRAMKTLVEIHAESQTQEKQSFLQAINGLEQNLKAVLPG